MFDLAESIPGPTIDRLADLARRHEVVIVAPLFERRAPGVYHNTGCLDADGTWPECTAKCMCRMIHSFETFAPGDLGFKPVETRYATGRWNLLNQWFPEGARLFTLARNPLYPTKEDDKKRKSSVLDNMMPG